MTPKLVLLQLLSCLTVLLPFCPAMHVFVHRSRLWARVTRQQTWTSVGCWSRRLRTLSRPQHRSAWVQRSVRRTCQTLWHCVTRCEQLGACGCAMCSTITVGFTWQSHSQQALLLQQMWGQVPVHVRHLQSCRPADGQQLCLSAQIEIETEKQTLQTYSAAMLHFADSERFVGLTVLGATILALYAGD